MIETKEELLKQLNEALAKPVEEILDKMIKLHNIPATMCLDPKRRATLITRVTAELKTVQEAVDERGYLLANLCVGRLMELCRNEYKLPDGKRSGEIDGLSQWLPNLASILEVLIDE